MTIRPNYELVRYTGNKLLGHAKEQIFSAVLLLLPEFKWHETITLSAGVYKHEAYLPGVWPSGLESPGTVIPGESVLIGLLDESEPLKATDELAPLRPSHRMDPGAGKTSLSTCPSTPLITDGARAQWPQEEPSSYRLRTTDSSSTRFQEGGRTGVTSQRTYVEILPYILAYRCKGDELDPYSSTISTSSALPT